MESVMNDVRLHTGRAGPLSSHLKALIVLAVLGACTESPPAPEQRGMPESVTSTQMMRADSPLADTVARGIAMALSDFTLRNRLRDDLRDSPYRRHALHLQNYLRGERGATLLAATARHLGRSKESTVRLLDSLPPLELVLERMLDRLRWRGSPDIVVYGSTLPTRLRAPLAAVQVGFGVSGIAMEIPIWRPAPFPYLTIRPIETALTRRPEGSATSGSTISTLEQEQPELMSAAEECDPRIEVCEEPPSGGGGYENGGVQLAPQFTHSYCFGLSVPLDATTDRDKDGLRDECEYQWATAFTPMLARNNQDEAPNREPYFSVTKYPNPSASHPSTVKLFFAISYYRDPGDPRYHAEAHDGDSEFIILEIHNTNDPRGSIWALDFATLSAHWNAGTNVDHTSTYAAGDLEYPSEMRGRPRIWVSWNKHANYRSKAVCDNMWNDDCDDLFSGTAYEINYPQPGWNLGNYYDVLDLDPSRRLVDCVSSRSIASPRQECYWTYTQPRDVFLGWHPDTGQAAAGPYHLSLSAFLF
jgi:hypothetical protein